MENEHSFPRHLEAVNSLCRLCGRRSRRAVKDKNKPVYLCTKYTSFFSCYNIDVLNDQEGKHSKTICFMCHTKLVRLSKQVEHKSSTDIHKTCADLWVAFDETLSVDDCQTCSHFKQQSKGGRPPPKNKLAAPKRKDLDNVGDFFPDLSFLPSSSCSASTSTPAKVRKHADSVYNLLLIFHVYHHYQHQHPS